MKKIIVTIIAIVMTIGFARSGEVITDNLRVYKDSYFHGDIHIEPFSLPEGSIPTNNLFAYYSFDSDESGIVSDMSGNGYDGTVEAGSWTSNGVINGAFSFNLTGGIRLTGMTSTHKTYTFSILAKSESALSRYLFDTELGRMVISWRDGNPTHQQGYYDGSWRIFGDNHIEDGQWRHLVYVLDYSSNQGHFYLDGQLVGSAGYSGRNIGGGVYIGADRNGGGGGGFNGEIDEVRIYTTALSSNDVLEMYSAYQSELYETTDPQVYMGGLAVSNAVQQTAATATNTFMGRTGIGTATPAEQLHVNGNARLDGDVTINGDLNVTGTISGDGSGLTNLNVDTSTPTLSEILASGNVADRDIEMGTNIVIGKYFGDRAGEGANGLRNHASGYGAGYRASGTNWGAFGYFTGMNATGNNWNAFGYSAGSSAKGNDWTALGHEAGIDAEGNDWYAHGKFAGHGARGDEWMAQGLYAGEFAKGTNWYAFGRGSARHARGDYWCAIGSFAGSRARGNKWYALGERAGFSSKGDTWLALGYSSGSYALATNYFALGTYAGMNARGHHHGYIDEHTGYPGGDYNPTNDMIFLDGNGDGTLHLGRPNGTVVLRGTVEGIETSDPNALLVDGSRAMQAPLDMGGHRLENVDWFIPPQGDISMGTFTNMP